MLININRSIICGLKLIPSSLSRLSIPETQMFLGDLETNDYGLLNLLIKSMNICVSHIYMKLGNCVADKLASMTTHLPEELWWFSAPIFLQNLSRDLVPLHFL